MDITGLRPERIAVVPSPLAELGMATSADTTAPATHPAGAEAGRMAAELDPPL
ncbi:DUF5937 family protein [Streptomyces sp. NPDC044948]|uniref:DUF5937 family protein n=1 Tax=Streptomyces sp. NPDC044948 TaxID=3157092 RepID=UPI0033C48C69